MVFSHAPHLGGFARTTSSPFRLRSTTGRVSRGVSAVGPVVSLGLGPARPSILADNLANEIRDASELFLLPVTPSTSTRTLPLPGPSSPVCCLPHDGLVLERLGVSSMGCCPPRPEIRAFHDAPESLRRIDFARRGRVGPNPCTIPIEPLTPPSRSSRIPVACLFAVHGSTDSAGLAKTDSTPPP